VIFLCRKTGYEIFMDGTDVLTKSPQYDLLFDALIKSHKFAWTET